MEIGWIYYGFSGAIANFVVWISHFFPSGRECGMLQNVLVFSNSTVNFTEYT